MLNALQSLEFDLYIFYQLVGARPVIIEPVDIDRGALYPVLYILQSDIPSVKQRDLHKSDLT